MKSCAYLCVGICLLMGAAYATPTEDAGPASEDSEQEAQGFAETIDVPPEYADVLASLEAAAAESSREVKYAAPENEVEISADLIPDPFLQKRGSILAEVHWQRIRESERDLIEFYRNSMNERLSKLSDEEKKSLYKAYTELIALIEGYNKQSFRHVGDVNEALCGWIDKSTADWPILCASKFVLIENHPSAEYWGAYEYSHTYNDALYLQTEIKETPSEIVSVYASQVIGSQGLPSGIAGNLRLGCGSATAIIGRYDDMGTIQFNADTVEDFLCPAPPPPEIFDEALLDLFEQLALVSNSDDDNDYLRDGERKNFVLKEDLLYCRENTGEVYLIPAGFVTDLLSVKGLSAFLKNDRTYSGAVIHDWLFALGGGERERKRAEAIFWEELRANKVSVLRSFFIQFGTDKLGPLYYQLFGKNSPFGRRDEMRFATKDSCVRGYRLKNGDEPYVVGRINQSLAPSKRCSNFQSDYPAHFQNFASSIRVEEEQLIEIPSNRIFLERVIKNKDPKKSCADF